MIFSLCQCINLVVSYNTNIHIQAKSKGAIGTRIHIKCWQVNLWLAQVTWSIASNTIQCRSNNRLHRLFKGSSTAGSLWTQMWTMQTISHTYNIVDLELA